MLTKKITLILFLKQLYSLSRVLELSTRFEYVYVFFVDENITYSNVQFHFIMTFFFIGYCAYYNTNNKEIMENYDQGFECLKFSAAEQCPSRYPSSEAYKCKFSLIAL